MTMEEDKDSVVEHLDAVVVGAGISGICAGYYLSHQLGDTSFTILESRSNLGGTWDLFKYPGMRSDSDMFTFSYGFHPWQSTQHFGSSADIRRYLDEVVNKYEIRKRIQFNSAVLSASFSTQEQRWTLKVSYPGGDKLVKCRFLVMCTGYYDYKNGFSPSIQGKSDFEGDIVHSQDWEQDYNVTGKRVVVVGSGATAVTVLPELAKQNCSKLTMLQRSPTYIAPVPSHQHVILPVRLLLAVPLLGPLLLPLIWAWKRLLNIFISWFFFKLCRAFPNFMKRMWLKRLSLAFGEEDMVHFTPKYNPWEQRVCADPDGVFFKCYKEGRFDIATDHISHFDKRSIHLKSGARLEADVVMLATGLNLKFGGGITVTVDGQEAPLKDQVLYRGMMLSNLPNCFLAMGYTNASWTLKVELMCKHMTKLMRHMRQHRLAVVVPRVPTDKSFRTNDLLDFSSSYFKRHADEIPKQGSTFPWKAPQSYFHDLFTARCKSLTDSALDFQTEVIGPHQCNAKSNL
mmetsp:Transcript_26733/g.52690  ORF Transcript_26733/g.52690 Transcript_26733/m.52690 type:complete len:513 (+) Transcript_26733:76-1614(+)